MTPISGGKKLYCHKSYLVTKAKEVKILKEGMMACDVLPVAMFLERALMVSPVVKWGNHVPMIDWSMDKKGFYTCYVIFFLWIVFFWCSVKYASVSWVSVIVIVMISFVPACRGLAQATHTTPNCTKLYTFTPNYISNKYIPKCPKYQKIGIGSASGIVGSADWYL